MRIAWCTPLAPASAIGRSSVDVVTALRELGPDVDLWYPPEAGGPSALPAFPLVGGAESSLATYDAVVYQVGNQPTYHWRIVEAARRIPGVVIVHDVGLVDLFHPWLEQQGPATHGAIVDRWYGPRGRLALERSQAGGPSLWDPSMALEFPLTELVVHGATAVVTHSQYAAQRLARGYLGEVTVIPLPGARRSDVHSRVAVDLPEDRVVVLQAGVVNENKHIEVVLGALAHRELRDRVALVVAGFGTPARRAELVARARELEVSDAVIFEFDVSDEQLHALRERADLATVLRSPCIEAASAVLVENQLYGLPSITVDDGFFAEVPAETVLRVPSPPTVRDVAAALDRWVTDAEGRQAASRAALAHATATYDRVRYARRILGVIERAGVGVPRTDLARQLGAALAAVGVRRDDDVVDTVARQASDLFAGVPRRG